MSAELKWHWILKQIKCKFGSRELDLFNESVEHVHKTGLIAIESTCDVFKEHTFNRRFVTLINLLFFLQRVGFNKYNFTATSKTFFTQKM